MGELTYGTSQQILSLEFTIFMALEYSFASQTGFLHMFMLANDRIHS